LFFWDRKKQTFNERNTTDQLGQVLGQTQFCGTGTLLTHSNCFLGGKTKPTEEKPALLSKALSLL